MEIDSTNFHPTGHVMGDPRFAFDIETVSPDLGPDEELDFEDSNQFELFISSVGYQPEPGSKIETELIYRDGLGPGSELDVIEETLDWIDERDGEKLLTFNGSGFDLIHLRGRAKLASEASGSRNGVSDRVEDFLEEDRAR